MIIEFKAFTSEGSPYSLLYEQAYIRLLKILCTNAIERGNYALFENKSILISQDDPFDSVHAFGIAHEIGHFDNFHHRPTVLKKMFTFCIQFRGKYPLILYPFVLWEETKAWKQAYRICKQCNIDIQGFFQNTFKSLFSYVKALILFICLETFILLGCICLVFLFTFLDTGNNKLVELLYSTNFINYLFTIYVSFRLLILFIMCRDFLKLLRDWKD